MELTELNHCQSAHCATSQSLFVLRLTFVSRLYLGTSSPHAQTARRLRKPLLFQYTYYFLEIDQSIGRILHKNVSFIKPWAYCMARRDVIHGPVRKALTNEGWEIVADPYRIIYKDTTLEADMKADKLIVATRESRSIVIEVKSFLSK